jgi:RAD54-like protein 2
MSSSNTSPHHFQYAEKDEMCNNSSSEQVDPLSLLEEKIKELNEETEENHLTAYKRKLSTDIGTFAQKKPRVKDENQVLAVAAAALDCEKENQNQRTNAEKNDESVPKSSEPNCEEKASEGLEEEEGEEDDERDKNAANEESKSAEDGTEIDGGASSKKDKSDEKRKIQNLRKNIKDVLDESQLDATTLAAQRQESERLARLQEAQRIMRETQRQQQAEKFANKTQQKVLSLLGESNEPITSSSAAIDLDDPLFEKLSLNPAISIKPATKEAMHSLISSDEKVPDSDDDDVIIEPEDDETVDKARAVVVDSSSDSDDCIMLSDPEEEEDEEDDDDNNSGEHTNDNYNQPDSEGRVVINIGHGESESDIFAAPQVARVIKPHQIGGVRFLFDNIIESTTMFKNSTGFGCILAHSMGLGKTLQVVCFCDIFLRHTDSKTILIIMPINTLQNWVNEFNMWIPTQEEAAKSPLNATGEVRPRNFKIHVLNDSHKTLGGRAKVVLEWQRDGGVLMMGYEIYRLLSMKKQTKVKRKGGQSFDTGGPSKRDQDLFDKIYDALVNPGPDLVVCDEGHRIKNACE